MFYRAFLLLPLLASSALAQTDTLEYATDATLRRFEVVWNRGKLERTVGAAPGGLGPNQGDPNCYGAYFVARDPDGRGWGVGSYNLGGIVEPGWNLKGPEGYIRLFRFECWTLAFDYKTVGSCEAHAQFILRDCSDPLTLAITEGRGEILSPSDRTAIPPGTRSVEAVFPATADWCRVAVRLCGVRQGGWADIWMLGRNTSSTNYPLFRNLVLTSEPEEAAGISPE